MIWQEAERGPGLRSLSVGEGLAAALKDRPDGEALVGRYERYTYRQLDAAASRAAAALARRGVGPGDRVAAILPNTSDIVVAFLGAMRLGAVWLGINRALAKPEKEYLLDDAEPSIVLADPDIAAEVGGFHPQVVMVTPGDPMGEWNTELREAAGLEPPTVEIDPDAPAGIAYTSGTTGYPKGVVHSQHNLTLVAAVRASQGDVTADSRLGVMLPLTILNVMILAPLSAIRAGGCCVAMDCIDPVGIAEWVRNERITSFGSVPTILHDLLTHPEVTSEDLKSLTNPSVGGADCPEEFRELYRERFGTEVRQGYGLTEAPMAVTLERPDGLAIAGSSGPALPHVRITVRDENGEELPPGEVGEVCVEAAAEGPWAGVYTPMLGYWRRDNATVEALRGGVLHTGDLGMLDENGNLFIKGRRGDVIIRGGANVYPAEVERILHQDPRVAACAVVGRPDERLGERVVAYVQVAPDETLDGEVLRAHCIENLARYKVPAEFRFVEAFPLTAMGKIRKVDLD
jgi:long-chain acyl-CoA synthetase